MGNYITSITPTEHVTLITLEAVPSDIQFLSDAFGMISDANVNLDMISQTAPTGKSVIVSFTVSDEDMPKMLTLLKTVSTQYPGIKTMVSSSNVKLSLFGQALPLYSGVAASAFFALARVHVDILLITTSDVDISILIPEAGFEFAYQSLKEEFGV